MVPLGNVLFYSKLEYGNYLLVVREVGGIPQVSKVVYEEHGCLEMSRFLPSG